MELLSCWTRPRHPFHAAYSHRKVNTFLLLLACPTFPTTSARPANWFQFAEKKERKREREEGEGSILKNKETNKSISYFFLPAVFFHWVIIAERQKWGAGRRREGKWLVRARLLSWEHIDNWEPVNGDEWLKWFGALARSSLGVSNQQPHLLWLHTL